MPWAKWVLLAASVALLRTQHAPPEFLDGDDDEIVMQRGSRVWRVDLSTLIRNNDCSEPYVNGERICQGRATAPCPECRRRYVKQLAWDGLRDKLYFAIETGTSKNNPWTMFSYSLRTHRVARFTNTWSSVLQGGIVSPDGHYLAVINHGHGGMCANDSQIEVVDLWERRSALRRRGGGAKDTEEIDGLEWKSASVLRYTGKTYGYDECRAGKPDERPVEGTLDVTTLLAQPHPTLGR